MARRTWRLSFLAVLLGVLLPSAADSAQKPDPRDRVLPNFDIRLQAPRVAPALDEEAQKQLEELRRDRPGLRTRPHGNAQGVRAITADGRPLTPGGPGMPEQIARRFLERYHHLLGLESKDLATLVRSREYRSRGEAVTSRIRSISRRRIRVRRPNAVPDRRRRGGARGRPYGYSRHERTRSWYHR